MQSTVRAVLVLLLALPSAAAASPASRLSRPANAALADWQVRQGRWRAGADGALVCEGASYSSLIYRKGFRARDFEVSVQVRFLGPESSAAIFFRAAGETFYEDTSLYQFEWYTRGHHHDRRLSLMIKNPPWRWKQIVTPIVEEAPLGKWIELRVRAEGELIQAFVDGKRVFEKRDKTFLRPGRLGLHVFQPRPVEFRSFRLQELTAPGK